MKHNKLTKLFICIGIIAIIIFLFIIVNKAISTKPVEVVEPEQLETESISESEKTANEEISTESADTEDLQENTSNISEPAQEIEVHLTDEEVIDESVEPESSEAPVADYTVEPLSATMYATQTVNVRDLPTTEGNKVGSKSYAESVEITGKVTSYKGEKCSWYQLSDGTFVSGNYLSNTKPAQQTSNINSNSNTGSTQSSSDTEGQTVSGATGDGSGSSRENRGNSGAGVIDDDTPTGGNLH